MNHSELLECSFFVPVVRDAILSDGLPHGSDKWEKLEGELYVRFEAGTVDEGLYRGFYKDPDTQQRVDDESKRYFIAIEEGKLDALRDMLREACDWFQQKCIYLSIAGRVEFIRPNQNESS